MKAVTLVQRQDKRLETQKSINVTEAKEINITQISLECIDADVETKSKATTER
jgi:hypothetical protein